MVRIGMVGLLISGVAAGREDPRPAVDAPMGVEVPQGRRISRRAQRRSSRRHPPADERRIEPNPAGPPQPAVPARIINSLETAPAPLRPGEPQPPFQPDAPSDSPVDAAVLRPAAAGPAGITTHRDQPYGQRHSDRPPHARQRFDLYLPAGCSAGGMPLVVWIHGDTWRDGSKADCPIDWLASEGYAVASIGYRLSDTAIFPAQLEDCRAAVAEIEHNADVWGIDRDRIAVVGSGAGGHLAALVGLSNPPPAAAAAADQTDAASDRVGPRIAAVCAVAAPSSLTTLGPEQDRPGSAASRLVGGPLPEFREAAQRASPVTHASADDPPVLLLHGGNDGPVPAKQSVEFDAILRAAGVDSTLVVLPGVGHPPALALGTPGGQSLLLFLDRVLGPGIRPEHAPAP